MKTWLMISLTIFLSIAHAKRVNVLSGGTQTMEDLVFTGQNARNLNNFTVKVIMTCYDSSAAPVATPLDPNGMVSVTFKLGNQVTMQGTVPSILAGYHLGSLTPPNPFPRPMACSVDDPPPCSCVNNVCTKPGPSMPAASMSSSGASVDWAYSQNVIRFRALGAVPASARQKITDGNGNTVNPESVIVQQLNDPTGGWQPVNAFITTNWSAERDQAEVFINFAAGGSFPSCGGYATPLMVFFDKQRPRFDALSRFPLFGTSSLVYWPEPKAPGYFLALDKNKNGKIDTAEELFGAAVKNKNGFDTLAQYDDNKDGWIDKADKIFSRLVLWKEDKLIPRKQRHSKNFAEI